MTKVCAKCKIEKDISEFRVDNKSKDKHGCWCKDCDREYKREYYKKHRVEIRQQYNYRYNNNPEYRARASQSNKQSREKNIEKRHISEKRYRDGLQLYIDDELKQPCVKCGESRKWLIQFHHVNPSEKSFQIQAATSKEKLLEESKKCVCLCSNCHTEYHYFYGKQPEKPTETLKEYLSEEFDSHETYIRKRTNDD